LALEGDFEVLFIAHLSYSSSTTNSANYLERLAFINIKIKGQLIFIGKLRLDFQEQAGSHRNLEVLFPKAELKALQ
jgi:hypothetical protein